MLWRLWRGAEELLVLPMTIPKVHRGSQAPDIKQIRKMTVPVVGKFAEPTQNFLFLLLQSVFAGSCDCSSLALCSLSSKHDRIRRTGRAEQFMGSTQKEKMKILSCLLGFPLH